MTAEQIYTYARFTDPQEQLVAVLGKRTAKEFFSTGKIGEGFAVLSNRRLYSEGFVCCGAGTVSPRAARSARSMSRTSPTSVLSLPRLGLRIGF